MRCFDQQCIFWIPQRCRRVRVARTAISAQKTAPDQPSQVVREAVSAARKKSWGRFIGSLSTSLHNPELLCQEDQLTGHNLHRAGILDAGAWRILPGNLERRFCSLSTVRSGNNRALHRATVSGKQGEQAVLIFGLDKSGGKWRIDSIRRDSSLDWPPAERPYPLLKAGQPDQAAAFVADGSSLTFSSATPEQQGFALLALLEHRGLLSAISSYSLDHLPSEGSLQISQVSFEHKMEHSHGTALWRLSKSQGSRLWLVQDILPQ